MVKNLKNLLLRNQKAYDLETRMLEYYQVGSNDDTGMILTYFTGRWNLVPYAKRVKQWIFQKLLSAMIWN